MAFYYKRSAWDVMHYEQNGIKYEGGMTLMEIVSEGQISRRTAYRYLAYYRELRKNAEQTKSVRK